MRLLLGSLFLLLSAAAASAQTAEETVAYLIFKVEDGAKIAPNFNDAGETIKLTAKSPAHYTISLKNSGKNFGEASFDVKKESDCIYMANFEHVVSGKVNTRIGIRADFSSDVTPYVDKYGPMEAVALKSPQECAFKLTNGIVNGEKADDKCRDVAPFPIVSGNLDRANKAMAFFRANFCKGRAF